MEDIKAGDMFTIPNSTKPKEKFTCTSVTTFDPAKPQIDAINYKLRGEDASVERQCCKKAF